jgi:hypothetical protein
MRHLNSYKIFESSSNYATSDKSIIHDLEDISLELEDIGLSPEVYNYDDKIEVNIYINNSKTGDTSNFSKELVDVILRYNDYMKSNNWETSYYYRQLGLNKKFYIKGDRLRNEDIKWIDDKWPNFSFINLTFRKSKINESKNWMDKRDEVISNIKDILLELNDEGYYTDVHSILNSYISYNLQIDISKNKEALEIYVDGFYEDIEPIKISEIKEVFERVLDYCKENNLKRYYHDINDNNMITYNISEIDDSNLKKLSIFLDFKI